MEAREAELLPVPYFHVVFTLPAAIADIAYQNKRVIYGLLMKASAETMLTIARDPKHLGAKIGVISVLHTWGSAMTHHPHVHMIVPGGGLSLARGEEGARRDQSRSHDHSPETAPRRSARSVRIGPNSTKRDTRALHLSPRKPGCTAKSP